MKLCIEAIIITWPPNDYTPFCAIKCIEIVHNAYVYNGLKGNFVVTNKCIWSQFVIFTLYTFVFVQLRRRKMRMDETIISPYWQNPCNTIKRHQE